MSDDVKLLVVTYLHEGTFRATLHVSSCAILKRVQAKTLTGVPDPRFPGEAVLEPDRYANRPGAENRPPKDHSCVAKYRRDQETSPAREAAQQPALI